MSYSDWIIFVAVSGFLLFLLVGAADFGSTTLPLTKENVISELVRTNGDIDICGDKIYVVKRKVTCWSSWRNKEDINQLMVEWGIYKGESLDECVRKCLETK